MTEKKAQCIFSQKPASCLLTYRSVTRGHNSWAPNRYGGAQSLRGRPIPADGAEKPWHCHKYCLQYSTFNSEKPQVRTWGRQNCFLPWAPSNLVTPLLAYKCCHTVGFRFHMLQYGSIGGISSGKKLIHLPWCCKTMMQTYCGADSRTALLADLKLFFRFAGVKNLVSVLSFPYLLPSYLPGLWSWSRGVGVGRIFNLRSRSRRKC